MSKQTFYVLPNPTSNIVTVHLSNETKIDYKVYSVQGQLVKRGNSMNLKEQHTIDLSELFSGLYFINVKLDTGKSIKFKVMKK